MNVNIKKLHPLATIPSYAKPGDAGLDLTATRILAPTDDASMFDDILTYGTDLSISIPEGYVGLLFPRSSISKYDLELVNSVGVIDSGYRGEIMFKFRQLGQKIYNIGDRIGQLIIIPHPKINLVEVDNLSESVRGNGGFGSSGE